MPRVMISYRNVPDQKKFAHELNDAFEAAGVDTWLDTKDIPLISQWKDEIIDGIKNSDYAALCLSEEYFESEICMMECYIARGYRKKILPIWLSKTSGFSDPVSSYAETAGLEYLISAGMHYQDFWGLPLTQFQRLQRVIDAVVNPIPKDAVYDIYISYRYSQAEFATQIADDLNNINLSTFVMTKHMNIGDNYHDVGWNAMLQAKYHIVILTPDIKDSVFVKNEIRVSQTKDTKFIPILAEHLEDSEQVKSDMRESFKETEFSHLNETQWLEPDKDYDQMLQDLIAFLKKDMAKQESR